jgi:phage protein D
MRIPNWFSLIPSLPEHSYGFQMPATSISILLPNNSNPVITNVHKATLRRWEYQHEILSVSLLSVPLRSLGLRTGDPVVATLKGLDSAPMEFVGYLHEPTDTLSVTAGAQRTTSLLFVGPTWLMKEPVQKVWTDVTISEIARAIIAKHGLAADVEDSSVRLPQISQAGESDWQFLCRIARRYGFVLYPTGVTVHFHSRLRDVVQNAGLAPVLRYETFPHATSTEIFNFTAKLSEAKSDTVGKARRVYTTVDPASGDTWSVSDDGVPATGYRAFSPPATFSDFTTPVATSPGDLQARLAGKQQETMWNHRAESELIGIGDTQPTNSLYLTNLGGDYDGLWTVLGVEFAFEYTGMFRMRCDLGTESLGVPQVLPSSQRKVKLKPSTSHRSPTAILRSPVAPGARGIQQSRSSGLPVKVWTSDIASVA